MVLLGSFLEKEPPDIEEKVYASSIKKIVVSDGLCCIKNYMFIEMIL